MKTLRNVQWIAAVLVVCGIIAATVLAPAAVSQQMDSAVLENVIFEEKDRAMGGYVYHLSANERLYVLSNALNNRILPQSDYFASIRPPNSLANVQTQSYAFQPVYRESEYNDATKAAALGALGGELAALSALGILPELSLGPGESYELGLFTAIDVLEPKKSVTVWQVSANDTIIRDGLVECVMDAQTHKLYSISLRNDQNWQQYDVDKIVGLWAEYLGASAPEPYIPGNPLTEDATYYQKYAISGMEGDKTIVTAGYYDGIREFFIKISR